MNPQQHQNTIYIFKQRLYEKVFAGCPCKAKTKAGSTTATISKVLQLSVKEFKCVPYALRSSPFL